MKGRTVYRFSRGGAEMKALLGGKGANLAEMMQIGLPVPPGFTISTKACNRYFSAERVLWPELKQEIEQELSRLEEDTGRCFGGTKPLLLSVRSGAAVSMPGMMDTILNLGLNRLTTRELAAETGDHRFALDCYRRFIQMFSNVVLGVDHQLFESVLEKAREENGVEDDAGLSETELEAVIDRFFGVVAEATGERFPHDPREQLFQAVGAVFDSWNTERALVYRRVNAIPQHLGTAVTVQAMVFGNLGCDSGTGVAFTRNPASGEKGVYGEYLLNAQGEDVVAGVRTPRPLKDLSGTLPRVYRQFMELCQLLEDHYCDMQDIEFTIEKGKLYLLQTREGKRTAAAAVKIAVDLVEEGKISTAKALQRINPAGLEQLLHPRFDPNGKINAVARGLPASPGAASGKIIFDADRARDEAGAGEKVILVRPETTPDDVHGFYGAQGILTSRGGMTSHAAVIARGAGKPCVCGCKELKIDLEARRLAVGGQGYPEGTIFSIDGTTGEVILGQPPRIKPALTPEFKKLLQWADEARRLGVRANADRPEDALRALELGAEGIGLCRTEHMFMEKERLPLVRQMILAGSAGERERALRGLLPLQINDFKGMLSAMAGYPVTIRLLDPPLHEFLPNRETLLIEVDRLRREENGGEQLKEKEILLQKVNDLLELNPMLGLRGCRLGLLYPEICRMQAEAVITAALELMQEGFSPEQIKLELMIPLVSHAAEMKRIAGEITAVAEELLSRSGRRLSYLVGTMIELPRACLLAGELAEDAEFFSFGTNDLTQTTLGFSRDDAERSFLPVYVREGILKENPFIELDREGVGRLLAEATAQGRRVRPALKLGVCGEHGGNPASIEFFEKTGLDYVSCSPYRVPVARLAAAQAALKGK
ncbi:MAG: pyruvate, phosphate dikinase [Firmicutes bacterium]|nr:pyruvate, phosphate dikinase [Bacillota bacterium]